MSKRYIDNVYEGRWKVVERLQSKTTGYSKYKLVNIYNNQEVIIGSKTMQLIADGKTSIYHSICKQIRKDPKRKKIRF